MSNEISVLARVGNDEEYSDVEFALISLDATALGALDSLAKAFAHYHPAPRVAEWDLPPGLEIMWLRALPASLSNLPSDLQADGCGILLSAEQLDALLDVMSDEDDVDWRVEGESLKYSDEQFLVVAGYKNAHGGVEARLPALSELAQAMGGVSPPLEFHEAEPLIWLQSDEPRGEALCGCVLAAASAERGARFTPCIDHGAALDPERLMRTAFSFRHLASDQPQLTEPFLIELERSHYGLTLSLDGAPILGLDLYAYSAEFRENDDRDRALDNITQAMVYFGDGSFDQAAQARWERGGVTIVSDHPEASSKMEYGRGELQHIIHVGALSRALEEEGK